MDNILRRISEISEYENITIGKIEQKIGASKGVLYKAIQNNTGIQSKWLLLIVENYPQISPDWLLTGKGKMLRNTTSKDDLKGEESSQSNCNERVKELEERLDFYKEKIEYLEQKILDFKAKKI